MTISRSQWGAVGTVPIDKTDKDEIAIHHSAGANVNRTMDQEMDHMRVLEQQHIRDPDIGDTIAYSYVVFKSGRSYTGRGRNGLAAATSRQNSGTWAICLIGDFRVMAPSEDQRRETRRLIEVLKADGARHLGGHLEFPNQSTECPGAALLSFVKKWRGDFNLTRPEAT